MLTFNGEKYFVEKEVSTMYGLSIHWFRKARYNGKSPTYHKLNRKVYYKEDEVDSWFKEHLIANPSMK
jgi:predicted DNA-binding transcriptional regulator AlpA